MITMESGCRKRKRAREAAEHEQSSILGMQEVPFPGWIDLGSSHDSPLPPGWEQCLDLQSGKMYFVNASTQTRVLEDPRILFKEKGILGKGESLGLDLEMRLPSLATMHPNANRPGLPSTFIKDIPNHCNGFHSNPNYDTPASNPSLLTAPFNTNLTTTAATNLISNMAATVCIYCHTFVMVSRQSPYCPNCKNVCNMDLSISSGK